jgi:tetratricopeptide (TPR) repeat protein
MLWDRARQQAVRTTTTERTVSVALGRAAQLAEQTQKMPNATSAEVEAALVVWQQAEDALAQAKAALTTGAAGDLLRQQVAAVQSQLEQGRRQTERRRARALRKEKLFRDLDEARLARSAWDVSINDFDYARAAKQYAAAFAAYGLEIPAERRHELARRITAEEQEVREALLVALADWSDLAGVSREISSWSAEDLLAVARSVDGDAWRQRFYTAAARQDGLALRRLSVEARQSSFPPSSLLRLAFRLSHAGEGEECLALMRWACRQHRRDFWLHFELGNLLGLKRYGTPTAVAREEAIGCYRVALALRPGMVAVHGNLGIVLKGKGELDEAIAEFREAVRLQKGSFMAHHHLGITLYDKGLLDEAILEYHEAIRLKKDFAVAHYNLGIALHDRRLLDKAILEYREAIRLKKDFAVAHTNLGIVLQEQNQLDEAILEYREAIRLKKDFAEAHYNLATALHDRLELDEAILEYREAIRLKTDYAVAHCNLGHSLRQKGQFSAALEHLRRGDELGKRNPHWHYPSARWVEQCQRLVELDSKLPDILLRKTRPANPEEGIQLARICTLKRLHRAAAGLYGEAFAVESKLANAPGTNIRYHAAGAAALAGCGQGKDADRPNSAEYARLRRQALDWLKADLDAWRRLLSQRPDKFRPIVAQKMRSWLADADFAGVRGPEALAKLPEAERPAWRQLWDRVAATLAEIHSK